jgi:hypothetical protein
VFETKSDIASPAVSDIEEIATEHTREDFQLMLAGVPYTVTVEIMRR